MPYLALLRGKQGAVTETQTLITAAGEVAESRLARADARAEAFEETGRREADLPAGLLTLRPRVILADHGMFTFNRLGIPASTRALLARAASTFVFHHTQTTTCEAPGWVE